MTEERIVELREVALKAAERILSPHYTFSNLVNVADMIFQWLMTGTRKQ
jgi:hypothetical protein